MIKLIGLVMIVGSCSAMGFFMNRRLRDRTLCLRSFITALQLIKAEIVFRALPLPEIAAIVGRECAGAAADFFGGVGLDMQQSGLSFWACAKPRLGALTERGLCGRDLRHIGTALYALGRYDGASQAEAIGQALRALEGELEAANRELGQKGRLYSAMGVTVGIMLALVVV